MIARCLHVYHMNEMTPAQIEANKQLCKHKMSLRQLENAILPNKIKCLNGCGMTWGELCFKAKGKEIYLNIEE